MATWVNKASIYLPWERRSDIKLLGFLKPSSNVS